MSANKAYFDNLRTLAFGSISEVYAALGTAFTVAPRMIYLINNTEGDMIFSTDNTLVEGQIFVPAGMVRSYNLTANLIPGKDDRFELPKGTQFYVKQSTAPASGAVYIETIYA